MLVVLYISPISRIMQVIGKATQFCSSYVCHHTLFAEAVGGKILDYYCSCNGKQDCSNTDADEKQNCKLGEGQYECRDILTGKTIPVSSVCDNKCDCYFCDDESNCNDVVYGMSCKGVYTDYIAYTDVCDGFKNCYDNADEANCTNSDRTCTLKPGNLNYNDKTNGTRYLQENQICGVPHWAEVCSEGLDQVNCTDHERVALSCPSAGFATNISIFAVCEGYPLCDDNYNNKCQEPEGGCVIHKNSICDGEIDCPGGADESETFCALMSSKVSCVRRVAKREAKGKKIKYRVPMHWVFDGEVDCLHGEDEDEGFWEKCGSGASLKYLDKGSKCQDVMKCPENDGFIEFAELCDKIQTCGRENELCTISRGITDTWNELPEYSTLNYPLKTMPVCFQGLENLQEHFGKCQTYQMSNTEMSPVKFIQTNTELRLSSSKTDCRFVYGEMSVYLSCTGSCLQATPCPLKKIPHDTCVNKVHERVFAITESNELTVVLRKSHDGLQMPGQVNLKPYHNELFPCNNKKCVLYSEVCNLVDDCGDGSDEVNCTNNFYCPEHDEYIPLSAKCDGHVDCRDYHDECNSDCNPSDQFILRNVHLRVLSCFVGPLATLFNGYNIVSSGYEIRQVKTFGGLMNKCFIILISFGDLLMGIYLVLITYADFYFGGSYCRDKYVWLSSTECSILGILSTIATQLSLFSMTGLSIFRIRTVGKIVQRSISARSVLDIILTIVTIFTLSNLVACIPAVTKLEDFFVNGLYYHEIPLFTGKVTKSNHYGVFRGYYGFSKEADLSWKKIKKIVGDMFTAQHGGWFENKFC